MYINKLGRLSWLISLLFCATLVSNVRQGAAASSSLKNLDEVERKVAEVGPKGFVWSPSFLSEWWPSIHSGLRSGDEHWIKITTQLVEFADAGKAEALIAGFGESLDTNPEGTLRELSTIKDKKHFGGQRDVFRLVCQSIPPGEKGKRRVEELTKRKKALISVSSPQLSEQRDKCLRSIEALQRTEGVGEARGKNE